ncbi:MAG TPA: preprotein translocase subunit SecG [Candidatus Babeliales bacterium]|nr:preprotein translocase subunit SecG [Candidatus Babeliales bacterium]
MLYGLLLTLFIIVSLLLVLVILIQQGKSSMGMGTLGGGAQMLFGGSGGQDVFQKTTWVLGALFMAGSFFLTLMRTHETHTSRYLMPSTKTAAYAPKHNERTESAPVPSEQASEVA